MQCCGVLPYLSTMNTLSILSLFHTLGMKTTVVCPGSRSAPLVKALVALPGIQTHVVPDERSAAFMALGISEATGEPVGVICTSGSAALNFAPACAEAYYRNIPLLFITADRPARRIGHEEGQSIPQENLYGTLVLNAVNLTGDMPESTWEPLIAPLLQQWGKGPLHINYAFEEPLYEPLPANLKHSTLPSLSPTEIQPPVFPSRWKTTTQKLVLCGQLNPNQYLGLEAICKHKKIPVIAEVTSNRIGAMASPGDILSHLTKEQVPESALCIGGSLMWRKWGPWFREKGTEVIEFRNDPKALQRFDGLTSINIQGSEAHLIESIKNECTPGSEGFFKRWKGLSIHKDEGQINIEIASETSDDFRPLLYYLPKLNPEKQVLHLGNSLAVRYADLIGVNEGVEVRSNRGVSGIDGCLSTATGHAIARPEKTHLVVLGDQTALYDNNGLWINPIPKNMKILILNNGGGKIFEVINGPSSIPDFERLFVNANQTEFSWMAKRFGLLYLRNELPSDWLEWPGSSILEWQSEANQVENGYKRLLARRIKQCLLSIG
jgi:2-succinyl-5-enolpyruvyl-6-hydroxy-3-cyclohexene-1-carboxylate synthase